MRKKVKNKKKKFLYYFEILITKPSNKVIFDNEDSFYLNLMSNTKIFSDNVERKDNWINDKMKGLSFSISKKDLSDDEDMLLDQVYTMTIKSESFDCIEPIRIKVLEYVKDLGFDSVYVLEDDISKKIATELYPSIYKVESFLRKYLIKFFVTKLGSDWWKQSADSDLRKKINLRKNNETVFSKFIDNEVYLIDFGDLGELIFNRSSGFLNKELIVDRILRTDDSVDALRVLKEEVQSNYSKFFKETFKINNFQHDWENLEKIRHKIAHNHLFTIEDQTNGRKLCSKLIKTIKFANEQIDTIGFSVQDREQIISNFIVHHKEIDKKTFLHELKKSIAWANDQGDGFVGLQNFITNILGEKGYEFGKIRELIKELGESGDIEIYRFKNDKTERGVASIRFKKPII